MLFEALVSVTMGGAVALPLDTDHLLSRPGDAKVVLVVDESCSMRNDSLGQICPGMVGQTLTDGGTDGVIDSKTDQLRAALTGCVGNDGVLDVWADQVEFAIMGFGGANNLIRTIHDFSTDLTSLENAVLDGNPMNCSGVGDYQNGIRACSNTPISEAVKRGGMYQQDWWASGANLNSAEICDRHYLVLLSDGNPNGSNAYLDFACDGTARWAHRNRPWEASEYMQVNGDMLCDLGGDDQLISTYTIGFGNGNFNESILMDTADLGGGFYEYAADSIQLSRVFDRILQDIVSKEAITFGAATISNNGFFSGNYAYISMFKPQDVGAWDGNLKKACILPDKLTGGQYDTSQEECLFESDDGTRLLTNPDARDQWAILAGLGGNHRTLQDTLVGGAARKMLMSNFSGLLPEAPLSFSDYWTRRDVKTWVPGTSTDYVPVTPSTFSETDAGVGGCARYQLMAFLHGYDVETFDCATLEPTHMDEWPMGAVINSGTALLAYDEDCETAGNCAMVTGTNNGQVHFFDAATGEEYSAIVPGDLWRMGHVTQRPLIDALNQPSINYKRLPLVDGGLILYHFDENANTIIDGTDDAYVVFGLGHGGSAYYFIDVSDPTTVVNGTDNPVYPIVRTRGHWTDNLRSTSAAPTVGRGKFPGSGGASGSETNFVAFTSGGIWEAADPLYNFDSFPGPFTTVPGETSTVSCAQMTNSIGAAGNYICEANVRGTPASSYDASALTTVLGGGSLFNAPYTIIVDDVKQVTGVTLEFVDLEPGDELLILDVDDNVLARFDSTDNGVNVHKTFQTSNQTANGEAVFKIRMNTDGIDNGREGIRITEFDVIEKPSAHGGHRPFMAVIDPSKINGPSPQAFADEMLPGPELLLVTNDCSGYGLTSGVCIDRTSPGSSDLDDLRCPISAPPAVYTEGGLAQAFYFGDWCGQIWRVSTDDSGSTWEAARILRVNEQFDPSSPDPNVVSRQLRKFERRLDLFVTGCQGTRAVGVSFGTGSINRPGAVDDLITPTAAPPVTNYYEGRDVVGTLFDTGITSPIRLSFGTNPDNTCGGSCLTDVTQIDGANPGAPGFKGFFFALRDDERMLRDSLTIDGITFYPTYQVTTAATICQAGVGVDRVYAIDNCTSEPAPANGTSTGNPLDDRVAEENSNGTIGGDLFVVTPEDGPPIVASGNMSTQREADLLRSNSQRGFRILFWYQPEEL
jgi:hypothetical protein